MKFIFQFGEFYNEVRPFLIIYLSYFFKLSFFKFNFFQNCNLINFTPNLPPFLEKFENFIF